MGHPFNNTMYILTKNLPDQLNIKYYQYELTKILDNISFYFWFLTEQLFFKLKNQDLKRIKTQNEMFKDSDFVKNQRIPRNLRGNILLSLFDQNLFWAWIN